MATSVPHSSTDQIESGILLIRGCRVMVNEDLALLYEVQVKALNQSRRRRQL